MNYKHITRLVVKHPKQEYIYYQVREPMTRKYLKCFRKEKDAIDFIHQYAREHNINEFNLLK